MEALPRLLLCFEDNGIQWPSSMLKRTLDMEEGADVA